MNRDRQHRLQKRWSELFEDWARIEGLVREAPEDLGGKEKAELYREWWASASNLLWFYVRAHEQYEFAPKPFPAELLARLAMHGEDLGNGLVSEIFAAVRSGPGRGKMWGAERADLAAAIRYLDACAEGLIADPSPVKTVAQAYGVTPQTVYGWRTRSGEILGSAGPGSKNPNYIQTDMEKRGARYSRLGRSASAQTLRGRD